MWLLFAGQVLRCALRQERLLASGREAATGPLLLGSAPPGPRCCHFGSLRPQSVASGSSGKLSSEDPYAIC